MTETIGFIGLGVLGSAVAENLLKADFTVIAYDVVAESKETYWAQQFRERGAEATWRAGQALREHAKRVRPDWPCEDDRAEDLQHHVALIALLDRAAHACAGR